MDSDPFRDARYVFVLKREETIFGPGGDIKPLSLNVVRNHCKVQVQNVSFHDLSVAENQLAGIRKSPRISSTRMSLIQESSSMDDEINKADATPTISLTGGNGEVYVNGSYVSKGCTVGLKHLDRVVIGGELLLLKYVARLGWNALVLVGTRLTCWIKASQASNRSRCAAWRPLSFSARTDSRGWAPRTIASSLPTRRSR
eukprot:scaffold7450_cov267-Pinguiococcus_pyrenoidosus.AAC.1